MVVKSDCGIWMQDEQRFISVARAIAVDAMLALKLDPASDFMTRDKIIAAISDRVQRTLDEVLAGGYRQSPLPTADAEHIKRALDKMEENAERKIREMLAEVKRDSLESLRAKLIAESASQSVKTTG